jgi:O-methyltransferase involved in polyketide biosynthesis
MHINGPTPLPGRRSTPGLADGAATSGFHPHKPTAWIAEGLLVGYLPAAAEQAILDAVTALSASGSRIAADHFDIHAPDVLGETLHNLNEIWRKYDSNLNLRSLTFSGRRQDPAVHLAEDGWTTRDADLTGLFRAAGQPIPTETEFPVSLRLVRFLSATRK